MSKKDEFGNWIDVRGNTVPQRYVKPIDQKRDRVVEAIVNKALRLQKNMEQMKADIQQKLDKYVKFLEKETDVVRTGKGNMTLTNFSGDHQVEFAINDIIEFDEQLQMAKELIDRCLVKWTKEGNKNIQAVITQAFNVDKKGQINKIAILKLRNLNIKDAEWKRAMDLISESIKISGSREYLNIRTRKDNKSRYKTVNLNFSSI
ncbi:MAG: DUF3164 family protein [Promethearchaeota archaeon]